MVNIRALSSLQSEPLEGARFEYPIYFEVLVLTPGVGTEFFHSYTKIIDMVPRR
jgi:hypothetical protein